MTLYTFLSVFLVAWAIATLVMNWRQQRKYDDFRAEIERLQRRIEELRRELERQRNPRQEFQRLRVVESDEESPN